MNTTDENKNLNEVATDTETESVSNFRIERVKKLQELYADGESDNRRRNATPSGDTTSRYASAAAIRKALQDSMSNVEPIVKASQQLYALNPIYANVIDYLANMYYWKYKITPHKVYTKSKAKMKKMPKEDDYRNMYYLMLEVAEGLSIETKFPALLTLLYTTGSVYFTTVCDQNSLTIDTILLPTKYCRKIAETQYGTAIIEFDMSYFGSLGLSEPKLKEYFKSFPPEFKTLYNRYLKKSTERWQMLDPHFSTGIMLNDIGIPTLFYLYGAILDYEKYQDNELERSDNLLKYLVVHTMPHYEDKLIFEVDEVKAIHSSLRKIVDVGDKARLITTYGDVHVDRIADNETAENEVLSKAYKAIFNSGGLNNTLFTGDSVEALKVSIKRDKSIVWGHIQEILNFYNIAVNNWFDFKDYQANIDILPISPYTNDDDMEVYRNNATLGVNKLDYIIASGVKQKNIEDQLYLERFLELDKITPMQTSYTQTAEDRDTEESKDGETQNNTKVIEESKPASEDAPSDIEETPSAENEPSADSE